MSTEDNDKRFTDVVRQKIDEIITFIDENKDNLPTLHPDMAKLSLDGRLFFVLHCIMDDMREGAQNFAALGKVGAAMYLTSNPSKKWSDVLKLRDNIREEVNHNATKVH